MIIKYTNLVNNTGILEFRAVTTWHTYMLNDQALRGAGCAERAEVLGVQVLGIPIPATPPGSDA